MATHIVETIRKLSERLGFQRDWYLIVVGGVIGTLTGLGTVGFALLLHFTETFSRARQAEWPLWMLPVIPIVGALLTGLTVSLFARDASGHGVPQVMAALIKKGGVIPLRVGLAKVAASIFTVGSGGSAGAEGPIVQIGSTAGSVAGQRLGVDRTQMGTLVGCGAAAGIASIFHAPIAGVFFVLEILLRDFSLKTFAPIVIASVLSSAVTQAALSAVGSGEGEGGRVGYEAIFAIEEQVHAYTFSLRELPSYIVLGIACGAIAVGFSTSLHRAEDAFSRLKVHPIVRPAVGALLLGVLGIVFILIFRGWLGVGAQGGEAGGGATGGRGGLPPFFGNGYEVIRSLLRPTEYGDGGGVGGNIGVLLAWLIALVVCKNLATVLTLGSGGSGGVFAPSLLLGAASGAAFGVSLEAVNLLPEGNTPASYALVGMAAVMAGAMHAPLTAILMIFELTRDVYVLLPIMLAAVLATVTAQLFHRDSIYTSPLRRAGLVVGTSRDLTLLRRIPVSAVHLVPLPPEPVYPSDPLSKLIALHAYHSVPDFVVVDQDGSYVGMVTGTDMRAALIDREAVPLLLVAELLRTDLPRIERDETLDTVMDKFSRHDVSSLPLLRGGGGGVGGGRCEGLVTRANVLKRYQAALEES